MEEDGESSSTSPLFWSQSQKAPSFSSPPPSSSSSFASGIRTWVLVLLVSIFVILFFPSFLSSNFRGFRPSLVKNGWDTLNLALVVFAILCGLLGRNVSAGGGAGEYREEGEKMSATSPPLPSQSQEWVAMGYSPVHEQSVHDANQTVGIRRMKSSSSYPDLRQEFDAGDNWGGTTSWRFADDIQLYRRRRSDLPEWEISGDPRVKTIQFDTFEVMISPSKYQPPELPQTLSPPRPRPPPPPPLTQMNKRTVKKLPHASPKVTPPLQPAIPPSPPPPPPPPVFPELKKKSHKKRSGAAAKDIATAITLFYNKRKRGSKAKKIHDDDSLASTSPSTPPPPPPPPPPPSSVFSQLFSTKKGGSKIKRFNSISDHRSPPPPPPPPPKKESSLYSDHRLPPRKKREKTFTNMNTYPIAPPSPLPPPPPPPPPPPAYEVGGDANSVDGAKASPFCPSPDVNNKADVFIKRFRDGLKLEKLNSIREKQRRQQDPPQERQQDAGIEMEMEQQIMTMMMMGMDDERN